LDPVRAIGVASAVLLAAVLLAAGAAVGALVGAPSPAPNGTTTENTTTSGDPPGAPTLNAAAAGENGIVLTWEPPTSDDGTPVTRYRVYRGTASGAEKPLTWVEATSYTDTAVVKGTTYYYRVSALNWWAEGPPSNERSATATVTGIGALFHPYQNIKAGSTPKAVAIGDVTGDGRNDIVMTTWHEFDEVHDFRLWVFAQTADGGLAAPVFYPTGASYPNKPESVGVGDVTGDGRGDVVLAVGNVGIQVFPQLTDGSLGTPTTITTPDNYEVRVGDLNTDGLPDVAAIGWGTDTVSVFLNNGVGGLRPRVSYNAWHDGWDDLEVADVTNDGRTDLVVMSGQGFGPNISVLAQLATGGFGPSAEYQIGGNVLTHGIGVGDVTADGRSDVVASYGGNQPSSRVAVFAQTASGGFAVPTSYPSYDIPEPVDVADLDLDGYPETVVLHGGGSAGVYRGRSDGALTSEELYSVPSVSHYEPHGLAVGDVNSDGAPDVVIADANNGLVLLCNAVKGTPQSPPPPVSVPAAPPLKSAAPGDRRVDLSWSVPPSNGGGWVGSYRVYRATSSGAETLLSTVGPITTDFRDTSVVNGTTYYYQVTAVNSAGEGPRSNERAATPAVPTRPGAPGLISATAGVSKVSLSWSPPASDGGAAIGAYRIYRGTSSGAETELTIVGNVSAYTDTSAVGGTTYFYQVSAINSVGEGGRSNELSAAPLPPPTFPGSPVLTSATAGDARIDLAWSAPATDGGAAITGYKVYRGVTSNGETLLATLGGVTSYADLTAANGTTYYYQITAVNSAGEGNRSNELSATLDGTAPSKPASLKLVVAGTNQLALDWPASTDNVGVSGYEIYRGGVSLGTTSMTQYVDSALAAGTNYTYTVRAVDAAGNKSDASSNLNAKTVASSTSSTGTLAGAVYDRTGRPLANAVVKLALPSGATKSTKTNASGVWKFSNLQPASYPTTVTLSGYPPRTLNLSAVAGKTVLASAVLAPA
jgi:fibronectin type 3 domain-containing protein